MMQTAIFCFILQMVLVEVKTTLALRIIHHVKNIKNWIPALMFPKTRLSQRQVLEFRFIYVYSINQLLTFVAGGRCHGNHFTHNKVLPEQIKTAGVVNESCIWKFVMVAVENVIGSKTHIETNTFPRFFMSRVVVFGCSGETYMMVVPISPTYYAPYLRVSI